VLVKLGADLPAVRERVLEILHDVPFGRPSDPLRADIEALFDDYERLRAEVQRLRQLLRRHGIDPDGTSASA
jgi:hypothetical protein